MWIRPPLAIKVVSAFSAAVVTVLVITATTAIADGALQMALTALATSSGTVFIVRAYRAGVSLGTERLTVHGFVWSRTIERRAIIKIRVDEFPAIVWRGKNERQRTTPLLAFASGDGNRQQFVSRVAPGLNELQRWFGKP